MVQGLAAQCVCCAPEFWGPEPLCGAPQWTFWKGVALSAGTRTGCGQTCVSTGLTPGSVFPHPSPHPLKTEAPTIPQFHFPLKHQTVILLNTIWRLLASAPHFSQTLINVTGVYSFFLSSTSSRTSQLCGLQTFILSSGSSALLGRVAIPGLALSS